MMQQTKPQTLQDIMRHVITFSPDATKLLIEVEAKMPEYLIRAEPVKPAKIGVPIGFSIVKTPTVRKGNKTLSLVRCTIDEVKLLASLKSITVLANIAAIDGLSREAHADKLLAAMSKTGRAKYDSVHDQTPVVETLPDGTQHTTTPCPHIGSFGGILAPYVDPNPSTAQPII